MDRRSFITASLATTATSMLTSAASAQAFGNNLPPVQQPPLSGHWGRRYNMIPDGVMAPDLEFVSGRGDRLKLQNFTGRPSIILFWATWCGVCMTELPALQAMMGRQIDPYRVNLLPISIDTSSTARVSEFMRGKGWTSLAHFQDPTMALFHSFGSGATPSAFLMDRYGRIIGGIRGAAHWDTPESKQILAYMHQA